MFGRPVLPASRRPVHAHTIQTALDILFPADVRFNGARRGTSGRVRLAPQRGEGIMAKIKRSDKSQLEGLRKVALQVRTGLRGGVSQRRGAKEKASE
jgi:hypothetical protein